MKVALVRNIAANNNDRHPEIGGRTQTFFVNNLIYNPSLPQQSAIFFHDAYKKGALQAVVKGNLLIPGPTTPGYRGYVPLRHRSEGPLRMVRIHPTTHPDTRIFLEGNYYVQDCDGAACLASPLAQWMLARDFKREWEGVDIRATTPPLTLTNLPLSSALAYTQVESFLKANAGARPRDRDAVDERIVREITSRSGGVPNATLERAGAGTGADGYPILSQNRRPLTVPTSPNAVVDGVGRTRIEMWLEAFARELEPALRPEKLPASAPDSKSVPR
jgi:hypothetical protein